MAAKLITTTPSTSDFIRQPTTMSVTGVVAKGERARADVRTEPRLGGSEAVHGLEQVQEHAHAAPASESSGSDDARALSSASSIEDLPKAIAAELGWVARRTSWRATGRASGPS